MSKSRLIVLSACLSLMSWSYAQQDLMMLNLSQVRQSSYLNPALGNSQGIHIGLPFISSFSLEHGNNMIQPSSLFSQKEGYVEFQTENYRDMVATDNRAGLDLAVDIFSWGFPYKENYFSFAIREKFSSHVELPADLLLFPLNGNAQFEINGGRLDLSDMRISLNHYTEYGFAWQRKLNEDLGIGLRLKALFGKENIRTKNKDFAWQTDPEDYTYTFDGSFDLQTAGIASQLDSIDGNSNLEKGELAKYIFATDNLGLGLDIGAQYELNNRWTAGLSIVDLGFVKYSEDVKSYSGVGSDIAFAGVEISESFINGDGTFSDSLDAAIANLGDALERATSLESSTEAYAVGLRTKAYFNLGYRLVDRKHGQGTAGLALYSDLAHGKVSKPMATISYTHVWNDNFTLSGSYSLLNQNAKNLGLAMTVKSGILVYYLAFDNIMWVNMTKLNMSDSGAAVTYPGYSRKAAVRFGVNLLFQGKQAGSQVPKL